MRGVTGFTVRLAVLATALVVGPATLAPGTAEAPGSVDRPGASDGTTAAKHYGWGDLQWDFAWEFGESLTSECLHRREVPAAAPGSTTPRAPAGS